MKFCIKNIRHEMREKYGERLFTIEGAIEVLEEMVCEDINRIEKDKNNILNHKILNDRDFNKIYDNVLALICFEETTKGFSEYRAKLNLVDEHINHLTNYARKKEKKLAKEKNKENIGPSTIPYIKTVFYLPQNITDIMGVR